MKLYHWTSPKNLVSIAMFGLVPQPPSDDAAPITAGKSVVWLTKNPSRDVESADVDHIRKNALKWSKPILFGDADEVRLTVKFNSTNRRHLYHWSEWISQCAGITEKGELQSLAFITRCFPPGGVRDYWVCLDPIPASQIELPPITARIAMLGLNENSEFYKECAAVPPETIVSFGRDDMQKGL